MSSDKKSDIHIRQRIIMTQKDPSNVERTMTHPQNCLKASRRCLHESEIKLYSPGPCEDEDRYCYSCKEMISDSEWYVTISTPLSEETAEDLRYKVFSKTLVEHLLCFYGYCEWCDKWLEEILEDYPEVRVELALIQSKGQTAL